MKYTKGSFITVPNKEALRGMKPQTQCLFLWLCSYANETGKCFPAQKTLSRDTGMSVRSIVRATDELIEAGILEKEVRSGKDRTKSNNYFVLYGGDTNEPVKKKSKPKPEPVQAEVVEEKVAGADINKLIDAFVDVNPSFNRLYKMKGQRDACRRLIEQHGLEKMVATAHFLPKSNTNRFAPTITTPYELEMNLGKLVAWGEKQKDFSHKGKKIVV